MLFGYVSTLLGLCLDLLGAFCLAVEAIGLNTIRSWRESGLEDVTDALEDQIGETNQPAKVVKIQWLPNLTVGIAAVTGSGIGMWMVLSIKNLGLPIWASFSIGAVLGGMTGAFFIDGAIHLLRWISGWLIWVEDSTRRGTIGVVGFILLAIGFIFQFLGNLLQLI